MKIGLIDPGSKKVMANESFPHLGFAFIAAVLEDCGHKIEILDASLGGEKEFQRFLNDGYDLIGLSATSFTFNQVLEIARKIKAINRDIIIVIGGSHVSIAMRATLDSPHVDYAVYGEGELTMLELTELLEKSREPKLEDLTAIKGLIFRDGDKTVVNPKRPRIDSLDKLPFPAFHLFDMEKYGIYPLLTSRGCPFGCSFCAIKAIWGTAWRFRGSENIVQEIDYARKRFHWGKKPFSIIDDSFNVDPDRVMHFCELVIKRGMNMQWFCWGFRADRVSLALALKMKEAGCIGVSVGIESASNEVLKKIGKKETLEEISRGCQNLARAGIPVDAQFMIGNIGDTFETVKKSIEFAKKHRFSKVAFYLALPYPRTVLWDYAKEKGKFLQENYTQFHHFCSQPVFETPEFSASERTKAYALGRRLVVHTRIKDEIRTKLSHIRRRDFKYLNLRRVGKVAKRLTKYFLDLALGRDEQV
jgi:anaerobic magnesium-protoporphyrin IX monomethyl ester cyclase